MPAPLAILFALASFLVLCWNSAEAGPAAAPAVRTIVVFGDSQAQGVAGALQRLFLRDRATHIIDKTVPGTALSQKLQFDWVDTIGHWVAGEHADIAIVMFGGNDRLAVRPEPGAHAIAYKTEAWKQVYSQRLNGVLGTFAAAKLPVVWLGQPVARESDYADDMAYLNTIFAEIVPAAGADFLPLWDIVTDDSGNYTAYGKGPGGNTERLRQDDGVHFTPAGYDLIAAKVKTRIDAVLAKSADPAPIAENRSPS